MQVYLGSAFLLSVWRRGPVAGAVSGWGQERRNLALVSAKDACKYRGGGGHTPASFIPSPPLAHTDALCLFSRASVSLCRRPVCDPTPSESKYATASPNSPSNNPLLTRSHIIRG